MTRTNTWKDQRKTNIQKLIPYKIKKTQKLSKRKNRKTKNLN